MLRRSFIAAIAAVAAGNGRAQTPQVWFEGPGAVKAPLQKAADGKLYLTAQIKGRDAVLFIDTGATTIIDLALAKSLGIELTDTGMQGYGLTGVAGDRLSARLDLRIGQLKITGAPCDCLDLGQLKEINRKAGLPEFDGLIGADLLAALRAVIDYDSLTLTMKRPGR